MRPLQYLTSADVVALATGVSALALPPPTYGVVPASWNKPPSYGSGGSVPELELELWADAAVSITNAVLYGARLHPLVVADQTTTFAASTDKATHSTHNLLTGDGPLFYAGSGTLPPEVVGNNGGLGFWAIKVDANTYKIATSLANALAGTFVDLSADSAGTITASDSADTSRVYWHTHDGLLGLAGDGAIALDVQVGYSKRIPHSPRVVAYAVVASFTGTVNAAIAPIQDQ